MMYAHVKYIWELLLEEKAMWTAMEDRFVVLPFARLWNTAERHG